MQLSVETNFEGVQRQLDLLAREVGDLALARALNKTIEQARTQMIRGITGEYAVTASYVRERLKIRKAFGKGGRLGLSAELSGSAKRRSANVIAFVERSVTLAQGRRRAKAGLAGRIFVQISKGKRKPLGPRTFIGNQGRTVFERIGKPRLPIRAVQTIDVPQMFNTKRINQAVLAAVKGRFPVIFDRELTYALAQFNARASR